MVWLIVGVGCSPVKLLPVLFLFFEINVSSKRKDCGWGCCLCFALNACSHGSCTTRPRHLKVLDLPSIAVRLLIVFLQEVADNCFAWRGPRVCTVPVKYHSCSQHTGAFPRKLLRRKIVSRIAMSCFSPNDRPIFVLCLPSRKLLGRTASGLLVAHSWPCVFVVRTP